MQNIIEITHDPKNTKVALLAGGSSNEREISLKSAEGAMGALTEAGYEVDLIDPSVRSQLDALLNGDKTYDFGFICLHGKGGEDGAIQGFLETISLPYTGSDVTSSAIAMDKAKAKMFYARAGVPTPPSIDVILKNGAAFIGAEAVTSAEILARLGGKVVVKVPTEGSSIGVYIVETIEEMDEALKDVAKMTSEILVEKYVAGREFTCVTFGSGENTTPFPVIEIIPKNASYDFESKYAPGGCVHICPAEISDADTKRIQEFAVQAHNSLGCAGATRTDFLLEESGDVWALETNTIPGLTATSLLPDAAKALGISFPELCTMMVQSGLDEAKIK